MCILDLVFNEGLDGSLSIVKNGRWPALSSAAGREGEPR
jgi:hypothetical protein